MVQKSYDAHPASMKAPKVVRKKTCPVCGEAKPVEEFYVNKDWESEEKHDKWCKECVGHTATKIDMRRYFLANRREFTNDIWDAAKKIAASHLEGNVAYEKANDEMREKILERTTCHYIPTIMGKKYRFLTQDEADKALRPEEAEAAEENETDGNMRRFDKQFNGYFKLIDTEHMRDMYHKLEHDYDLDTENMRDYAKKICKASLLADRAQEDYALGKCDFSVVKDAIALFDMLSKSANFAACKRVKDDTTGIGSWSEMTLWLETNGRPCIRKIEWEPDDVDRTIQEFCYTQEAIDDDR